MIPDISNIVTRAVDILLSLEAASQQTEVFFEPNDQYADASIRGLRKGGGFMGLGMPAATTPFHRVEITMAARPGVLDSSWVGYTIVVIDANTRPTVESIVHWPQSGGQKTASPSILPELLPHVALVLELRVAPMEPPKQTPFGMF